MDTPLSGAISTTEEGTGTKFAFLTSGTGGGTLDPFQVASATFPGPAHGSDVSALFSSTLRSTSKRIELKGSEKKGLLPALIQHSVAKQ